MCGGASSCEGLKERGNVLIERRKFFVSRLLGDAGKYRSLNRVRANLLQHVKSLMMVLSDSCREMVLQYSPWKDSSLCCHEANTSSSSSSSSPTMPHIPMTKAQAGEKVRC